MDSLRGAGADSAGAVGDGGVVMCETKRCGNGEDWHGEFWNHYSRCDNGITGHANILEPFVSAIKKIEASEQAEAEREMKALESEYLKSGYWPEEEKNEKRAEGSLENIL